MQAFTHGVTLSGAPIAGGTWSVTLSFNDGAGLVTSTHEYVVRATVPLAEVAAGLAAKINAAGTSYSARVQGNTLVIENASQPGFTTGARVVAEPVTTGGVVSAGGGVLPHVIFASAQSAWS